jgi:hypothetical protein
MDRYRIILLIPIILAIVISVHFSNRTEIERIFEQAKESNNQENNLYTLEKKGLQIIEDQCFWIELKNWGKVKFVSTQSFIEGISKVNFYLIDDKKNILYYFPDSYGNDFWHFEKLRAVSFKDMNKDGLKDILIIAEYITGIGKEGVIPFPIGSIYFQKEKVFINVPELDEAINDSKKNENIDMLLKFMKSKNVEFSN